MIKASEFVQYVSIYIGLGKEIGHIENKVRITIAKRGLPDGLIFIMTTNKPI